MWRGRVHMQGNCPGLPGLRDFVDWSNKRLRLCYAFRLSRLTCTSFLVANHLIPYTEALVHSLLIRIQEHRWLAYNGDARGWRRRGECVK